jgi:hypothetical protein
MFTQHLPAFFIIGKLVHEKESLTFLVQDLLHFLLLSNSDTKKNVVRQLKILNPITSYFKTVCRKAGKIEL